MNWCHPIEPPSWGAGLSRVEPLFVGLLCRPSHGTPRIGNRSLSMQSVGCNRWCSTDTGQWFPTTVLFCTGVLQGLFSCAANWWRVSTILPSTYYSIGHEKKHLNFTSSNSTTSLVIYYIIIVVKNSIFSANISEIYKYFTAYLTKPATIIWNDVISYDISASDRWIIFPSRHNYSDTGAAANN